MVSKLSRVGLPEKQKQTSHTPLNTLITQIRFERPFAYAKNAYVLEQKDIYVATETHTETQTQTQTQTETPEQSRHV